MQNVQSTITVSGSTQVNRLLYVFIAPGNTSCATTPANETGVYGSGQYGPGQGTELDNGADTIAAGSFSQVFDYTPATAGSAICAVCLPA